MQRYILKTRMDKTQTIDFKQSQSSTRGKPRSLLILRKDGPFSGPNKTTPMMSKLPSRCFRCSIVLEICFSSCAFLSVPSSNLLYCRRKNLNPSYRILTNDASIERILSTYHFPEREEISISLVNNPHFTFGVDSVGWKVLGLGIEALV